MSSVSYLDGLILGKGTKVKELLNDKYTQDQLYHVVKVTGMNVNDVLELSEIQFDAVINRIRDDSREE